MNSEQKCARCGDDEFRIDGYCDIYCRDMHDVEKERDIAEAQRAEVERERDAAIADRERFEIKLDAARHNCGCEYDEPGQVCMAHAPKIVALTKERDAERARAERWKALAVAADDMLAMPSTKWGHDYAAALAAEPASPERETHKEPRTWLCLKPGVAPHNERDCPERKT